MAALSTSLKVTNKKNETLFTAHLWWWSPYRVLNNELFTVVYDNGYIDRIAQLNLQQFVDLNREQIQQYSRDYLYRYKDEIEVITAHIRSGAWDDATMQVAIEEWESGLG